MQHELPKNYSPKESDSKWYSFWEEKNLFKADPTSNKPPYCIVIPPPNVTGALHMGHALVNTLQDILVRFHRMLGYETLWVPGTDHAGIATQTVVEKQLFEKLGKRRSDFTREEFLSHIFEWKEIYEKRILGQLKRIGSSCDWSETAFTMDKERSRAVRLLFKKLYDQGLIYRGLYLVNWDPVQGTAIADDEVEYEERMSSLWSIRYPLEEGSGSITVATTRPETMLGDTAVAVHPNDPRYKEMIGKKLRLPLTGRLIPVIGDARVDKEFGTGAVKITPAHDPNDYQMGRDHQLPMINIMTPDGRINEEGGAFKGMLMQEAREAVIKQLEKEGLLVKREPHTHRVGISYRSKAVIEPYLSKQWFINMGAFKEKMLDAVMSGKTALLPKQWENTYRHWIENLRNWCISRQLWWGHRIPIWYNKQNPEKILCYDGDGVPNPEEWEQDEDVLDTWFSSALWPFATLGWPEKTALFEKFYPNSVLVTGHDILFFWVARMIMMGEYATGRLPFPAVFLHGLIFAKSYWRKKPEGGISYLSPEERREYELGKPIPKDVEFKWEKMSKTKGNVIDPIEIIDEYGTDAMRFALASSVTASREIDLDRRKFEEFRNFTNKVWNGARFVLMNLTGEDPLTSEQFAEGIDLAHLALEDRWILEKLSQVTEKVTAELKAYAFDQAALSAYDFFWKEFCAYYVEIVKPTLFGKRGSKKERKEKQKLLAIVLLASIRLLHPMAPFITEEIFHELKKLIEGKAAAGDLYTQEALLALNCTSCMVAPYPDASKMHPYSTEKEFQELDEIIYTIRNIRGEMKVNPGLAVEAYIVGNNLHSLEENQGIISSLVKVSALHFVKEAPSLPFAATGVAGIRKVLIPLPNELLIEEKKRLEKEREKLFTQQEKLKMQLASEEFLAKAPAHLVESKQSELKKRIEELSEMEKKITSLNRY